MGPHALAELTALGIADRELGATNVVREASFVMNGTTYITHAFPTINGAPVFGKVVPRVNLDAAIFNAARRAGARTLESTTVTAVESRAGAAEVIVRDRLGERCLRTRIAIGADGSTSAVARSVHGRAHPRADRIIAARAYVDGIEGDDTCCDLHFSSESFPGYAWFFPTGNKRANVGIGMLFQTVPPCDDHLRDLLLAHMHSNGKFRGRMNSARVVGRIVGWPLSTYNPRLSLVEDNVLLLGDAAGLINPLNGEGIQYALLSARWAAPVVIAALRNGDTTRAALLPYQQTVRARLGYDMALSRFVVRSIANRALNPLWLLTLRAFCDRARRDENYAQVAGGILAGLIPARDGLAPPMLAGSCAAIAGAVFRDSIGSAANAWRCGTAMVGHGLLTARWFADLLRAGCDLGAEAAKATFQRRGTA